MFDEITDEELLEAVKVLAESRKVNIIGSTKSDKYLVKRLNFE
jgi:hypothetical protein